VHVLGGPKRRLLLIDGAIPLHFRGFYGSGGGGGARLFKNTNRVALVSFVQTEAVPTV
jgi:hypothetical protein